MPYMRGHVRAPNKNHLIALSAARNGDKLRRLQGLLAPSLPASYDARVDGIIPAVRDQGGCGSCWNFSGTGVVDIAFLKAGYKDMVLSEQYTMSCGNNGGCNGDDNTNVLDWAKKTGLPLDKDYGPYTASSGRCNYSSGMSLFKVDDWGFADGSGGNGVTPTEAIKAAIIAHGCVGCAVAAGSSWDSWSSDPNYVHKGGSSNIDHDVILIGWDDAKSAWIMRNSWGTGWAWNGYGLIAYGADSIGTEAVWAYVKSLVPSALNWADL